MSHENNSESTPDAESQASAEDVRDLLLEEEDPLNVAAISETGGEASFSI